MKQKIEKLNWYILIFIFSIELIGLNIVLKQCGIALSSNPYGWIRAVLLVLAFDIIYILYIFDILNRDKKIKNILFTYKKDANLKFSRNIAFLEIIKLSLILLSTYKVTILSGFSYRYIRLIILFILVTITFYILHALMSKSDDIAFKLKKLRKDIKKGKTEFNFILIDGSKTSSSFDLINLPKYKIEKYNIYININKDLPEIVKYNEKAKSLVLSNTVAVIHEINDIGEIKNILEKQTINNFHMYHIMAVSNLKNIYTKTELQHINALKICDLENDIQFVENILSIEIDNIVNEFKYKRALKKLSSSKFILKSTTDSIIKNIEITCKYNFNNRLKDKIEDVPTDKYLFELFRNAYLNKSPYQSVLIFFNYITVCGKLIEYYLYSKYNKKFDINKIDKGRIGDNPSIWNSNILINLYKQPQKRLYRNLREKKYNLSRDEKVLIKYYLSNMIDTEIKGDNITYDGMMNLFIAFRNKVEAHGILNDDNIYAVWNITHFFVNYLNKFYDISNLNIEYDNMDVKVGYKEDQKINLGKYVIMYNNYLCFIKDKDKYINYFAGEVKPSFIKK